MASDTTVYEICNCTLNPKDYKTAVGLVTEHYEVKQSELFGFWTTDAGDQSSQFVHILEYESMSHRRQVNIAKASDEDWNKNLLDPLLPCIQKWDNALLAKSAGYEINVEFEKDESAVYLLDQAEVRSVTQLPELNAEEDEILVGRFCALFGQSNTEYRLWRYTDIDLATECAKKRAIDSPFDGISTVLLPMEFSPMQ